MNSQDYINNVKKLESGNFHPIDEKTVIEYLEQAFYAIDSLDRIKKAVFYGRNAEAYHFGSRPLLDLDPIQRRLFHAILGITTEAGELIQALLHNIRDGEGFDTVNLTEEAGDLGWYEALLMDILGTTPEAVRDINIAKLKKRYPDLHFTESAANNRDLDGERKLLEESSNEGWGGIQPHGESFGVGGIKPLEGKAA